MALLDTHLIVKNFIKHGFSEEQAEAIVEVINDRNTELVTKNTLEVGVSRLENKINILESHLENKIDNINTNVKWVIAITLLLVGILLKNTFI